MQEILDIFLEKSKQHHSNIIYAQIYKNDLLKEEFRLFPVKTRLNIWSISKPFVAMAAGIAEREGLITLDEYIYPWFEKYFPSDPSENLYKIKIRDLLTMSSGQKDPLFFCDGPERYREKDWGRYFFQNDSFPYTPGTHFVYSNFCSYILSVLLEEKSGTGLLNYLRYRFFEPVGIPNPDWTLCPQGHCMAANGLYLTIDELARFGHLLLHEGSLNGKQIVPKKFVIDACQKHIDSYNPLTEHPDYQSYGYGYFIYMGPMEDTLILSGNYGQYCVVDKKRQMVSCVMSLDGNDHKKIRDDLVDSLAEYYGVKISHI